ncbi:MAG: hypothetical protein ABL925_07645 [Methylococcales bacterium]
MKRFICITIMVLIGNSAFVSTAVADLPPQWVWSTFEAEAPSEQSVLITEVFKYTETIYKSGGVLKPVAKKQR